MLTKTMRVMLRGAIHRTAPEACWQLPHADSAGAGRCLSALKARGLVRWLNRPGACWVLTKSGERVRTEVVATDGPYALLAGSR